MAIRREILFSFEGVGWVVVPTGLPSVCGRNSDFSHTHYQNVCASTHILVDPMGKNYPERVGLARLWEQRARLPITLGTPS